MIKKIGIAILVISPLMLSYCDAQPSLRTILCGVWYTAPAPEGAVAKGFSWGRGVTVVNGAIEIDMFGRNEAIFLPGMGGPFHITKLAWTGVDVFELSFFFDRGKFQVDYRVHYGRENGTLWFEDVKSSNFIVSGPDHPWFKISGPDKK